MQRVEELLGANAGPIAHADAEAATQAARVIGEEVALVDDTHLSLERALHDTRSQFGGGVTEDECFTALIAATPTRRKGNHGSVLCDHRSPDSEAALDGREFDERAARRKDELDMGIHALNIPVGDGQAIIRIQKRSIDIAEQGNSRKPYGAQRTRAHGP